MDVTPLESFLTYIGSFFSNLFSWIEYGIFTVLEDNPIWLIFLFGMPIVGFVVGLFRRLKNA